MNRPSPVSLAGLRFPVEQSRGRRYPELTHPYRNEFQRDRDRIVHTRAFRRLEDKTQVFTWSGSDHFRNRLTHTIEVAQISRTIASVLNLNEDLVETLALTYQYFKYYDPATILADAAAALSGSISGSISL